MEYILEKGVSIEKLYVNERTNYYKAHKFPYLKMELNDSFVVPYEGRNHQEQNLLQSYILSNFNSFKKYHRDDESVQAMKIATRRNAVDKYIRVWRIA